MSSAIAPQRDDLATLQSTPSIHDYDCIVGNVATYLHINGIDPDTVLGHQLTASPVEAEGTWTYAHVGSAQIQAAQSVSPLTTEYHPGERMSTEGPYVAVGDGFDMPWTPYFGRKHLEHGFLVLAPELAYDAYDTLTEFGAAEPQILPREAAASVPISARISLRIDPNGTHVVPSPSVYADDTAIRAYLADLDSRALGLEQLAVDTWVLSRARRVNTRYATAAALEVSDEVVAAADAWTHAAEAVYFALRRQNRGREVPNSYMVAVHSAVEADETLRRVWA